MSGESAAFSACGGLPTMRVSRGLVRLDCLGLGEELLSTFDDLGNHVFLAIDHSG